MTSLPRPEVPRQPPPEPPFPPPPNASHQQPLDASATPRADGLAIASMILAILWIFWIGSVLAIIFAAVAIRRINRSNGSRTGKGMAIAGLVLGIIGVASLALVALLSAADGVTETNKSAACNVERKTLETAVEAYYAIVGTDHDPSTADLVQEGLVVSADSFENYTVSDGVVQTNPDGDC